MIILEQESKDIRERALSLFASRAKRAVGIRGELSIRITSSGEMQELNRRFRRKNKPTDVLSFPADMPKLAGDIAISADIASVNAVALGHSVETELKILILHGLLHLVGYDHETDNGEMQRRESRLRRQLNLPDGLIERAHGDSSLTPRGPAARAASRRGRRR